MEVVLTARNGQKTAEAGGVLLHSAYDPDREADRLVESLDLRPGSFVLILGASFGHLARAVRNAIPDSSVIEVHYSDLFRSTEAHSAAWYPSTGETLSAFFSRHIDESSMGRLRVIDWEPAARAYPTSAIRARNELAQHLRQVKGSAFTTATFGRLWLRNSLRNGILTENLVSLPALESAVCVCASGPSLAEFLLPARQHRARIVLCALPSALPALRSVGLRPDFTVMTDPGFHSFGHIRAYLAAGGSFGMDSPLVQPLSGAPGAHRFSIPVAFLDQGNLIESQILHSLGLPIRRVPANGTVAGTAVELALSLTTGPVVVAGLDFSGSRARGHVSPSSFDDALRRENSRTSPHEGRMAAHYWETLPQALPSGRRTSNALRTYAGWFRRLAPAGRVFRYAPTEVDVGLPPATMDLLAASTPPRHGFESTTVRVSFGRLAVVKELIAGWLSVLQALCAHPTPLDFLSEAPLADELLYQIETSAYTLVRRSYRIADASAAENELREIAERARVFIAGLKRYTGVPG